MKAALPLFEFLIAAEGQGRSTALVTITAVSGGSSRAPGTQLAVDDEGGWHGSLSGGCVEAAVVAEARRVIASGVAETIRFGAGSRFIDIRLPCGGAIDLLFTPLNFRAPLREIRERLMARHPVALALGVDGGLALEAAPIRTGWDGPIFRVRHDPDLRLVIVGHGAEIVALAKLALAYGAIVEVHTPDPRVAEQSLELAIDARLLRTSTDGGAIFADPRTAVVLLFHDHDWEADILASVLEQEPFYVGAMGSRETHRRRISALQNLGVPKPYTDRITGPIGFLPAARDPETLALSILGEIVARQHPPVGPDGEGARSTTSLAAHGRQTPIERPGHFDAKIGETR